MTEDGTEAREKGLSVRFRLLAIALLPTLVVMPLVLGIAVYRWNANFDAALISKVNGDLTIAHQYLARILEDTGKQAAAFGASARFRDAVDAGTPLDGLLDETRSALDFDFLYLIDDKLKPVASARPFKGQPRTDWPIIVSALANKSLTSIDIFNSEDLAAFAPELATRARVELVPTPNALATDRTVETRGMVIHSATPVTLSGGRPGALVGGVLLNTNLKFIDMINELVYREASLPKGSQGTATIFIDDVRIGTNVRLFEGERANGTRVSAAVRSAVLDQGRIWLDRAFVVNDWYISAYEPLADSTGRRIGMLYVGFLEAPFVKAKRETLWIIALAFLTAAALSVPMFLHWAGAIFRPLERMMGTIAKVETGDLSARTGAAAAASGDEIGRVAAQFDHLLELLQERERQLRGWNEDLNARVAERTHDLEVANRELEATTKQLVMSEKLAVIGEITAGVAHEINNPIAVMQGNLEVVRSLMENNADPAHVEFRLLDEQIHRISQIVTKLLQFSRPEEYADYVEQLAPDEVIIDSLPLIRHLLKNDTIEIIHLAGAQSMVRMNRTELQQVLVNLMVNAIHAMPDGGRLFLRTREQERNGRAGVVIEVADTGVGMSEEVKARIFDPFFTTKRRSGTGLGLSISHKLVTRQGGMFDVESEPGKGTTFAVWLPATI